MAERKRIGGLTGGPTNLDPEIIKLRNGAATNQAALTRKQKQDRERVRARYDIDPRLKKAIEDAARSEAIDTSFSQFAEILLAYAYANFKQGKLERYFDEREFSNTPRFRYNYDLPEDLETFL
jgi:hypothetical protein